MNKKQNADDMDLLDDLSMHIAFLEEAFLVITHPDFAGRVENTIFEARDRVDLAASLTEKIGIRLVSQTLEVK